VTFEVPDRESSADLAAGLVERIQTLARLEVELAKQEAKELAVTNGWAAGLFMGAGLLALVALLVGVPVLIVTAVPWHWQAALAWVLLYLALAVGMALLGRAKLRLEPPQRTLQSLKETRDWALHQLRSNGR
jgi:uncharacterized membrane protein YqjE